ncbi:MAG: hypothetical protein ACOH16_06045 [Propionibacteriaceae bacterium]
MVDPNDSTAIRASSVTVNPGDIDAFSKVMSAITCDIDALASEMTSLISVPDMGEYYQSPAALKRYQKAATTHREFTAGLALRADKLVAGTCALARQYRDLEDLNASGAAVITSYLGTPQES